MQSRKFFFWSTFRNNCFSGGFGNGKTWIACARQYVMLATFPGYISLFARQYYKDLKATTMKTFFKICPQDFVVKHDLQEGITIFANGSVAIWLHLDSFDEQSLRGLEINSACLDQVEETVEPIYLVLDARIGRWDGAQVPEDLLLSAVPNEIWAKLPQNITKETLLLDSSLAKLKDAIIDKTLWPRAPDGRFRVRNFIDVLCNPDNQFHWVYRRYHPESFERKKNHFYIERETDERLNDPETIENMKDRDEEWVDKYFRGKWGRSAAQIHKIEPLSIINPDDYTKEEFTALLKLVLTRGALSRVLDHGESAPTCCLWFAAINRIHICYREYYFIDDRISIHRQNIYEMSKDPLLSTDDKPVYEFYEIDLADPSIFYKTQGRGNSKNVIKTSVAEEYATDEIDGPPIIWSPGDNNEMATRNRINELLRISPKFAHPITKISPAPGIYFIKQTKDYQFGCNFVISQTQNQRKKAIGSENGRTLYSGERDDSIADHAYDPLRYYIAEHSTSKPEEIKKAPQRSFAHFEQIRKSKTRVILPGI
jgi:hypothetical protein